MPKADTNPTQNHPAPQQPRAALPTVADLGRHHAALWRQHGEHDRAALAARDDRAEETAARARMEATQREIYAVRDMMFSRPIATLADACALAVVAHGAADAFAASAASETARVSSQAEQWRDAWARVSLVLADAAGVDLATLDTSDDCALLRRHAAGGAA